MHPRSLTRLLQVLAAASLLSAPAPAQQRNMGLIYHDSTRSFPGYTLFAPLYYNVTYLIDNQGRLVHSWQAQRNPALSCCLLENGDLLRTTLLPDRRFRVGGSGGRLERFDWEGNLAWRFDYSSPSVCQHHDVEPLPGGNVLIIAWEWKTRAEAVAAGRDPTLLDTCFWPDHLVEVDPETDSIVWEWHTWDHLIQDFDSTRQNYGTVRDHPELIDINYATGREQPQDWLHTNSVYHNAELDQVVISPRHYSELWVIDHSTTTAEARGHTGGRYGRGGDLLYRWGNPAAYGRGGSGARQLFAQHDPQWIADSLPGAGNILIFNNGTRPNRTWSSVDEIDPPCDSLGFYHLGPDSTYGPEDPTWSYADPDSFYSEFISGSQRLPNGNTLVCEGNSGEFFEVTPDSQVVWRYICPVNHTGPMTQGDPIPPRTNSVFRVIRYSPGYQGFEGRNLTPGDPIERYPQEVEQPVARTYSDPGLRVSPSPFRLGTTFSFSLSAPSNVELAVFNSVGERVAVLYEGSLPPGRHSLHWQPQTRPTGAYFARLRVSTTACACRVLFLR